MGDDDFHPGAYAATLTALAGLIVVLIYYLFLDKAPAAKSTTKPEAEEQTGKKHGKHKQKHQPRKDITAGISKGKKSKKKTPQIEHELLECTLKGHRDNIIQIMFSPNGHLLASVSKDNSIRVWSASSFGSPEPKYAHVSTKFDTPTALTFSQDSKYLAVAVDKRISFYGVSSNKDKPVLKHLHDFETSFKGENPICSVTMAPTNDVVGVCGSGNDTHVHLHATKGKLLTSTDTKQIQNHMMTLSPDGEWLGVAASLGDVKLLQLVPSKEGAFELKPTMYLKGHKRSVNCISFSADSKVVASACANGSVKIWSLEVRYHMNEDPRVIETIDTGFPSADLIAVQPHVAGREAIVAVSHESTLRFYSASGQEIATIDKCHEGPCRSIVFSQNGKHIATCGDDKSIRLWKVPAV